MARGPKRPDAALTCGLLFTCSPFKLGRCLRSIREAAPGPFEASPYSGVPASSTRSSSSTPSFSPMKNPIERMRPRKSLR
jgi:hypothetical protein